MSPSCSARASDRPLLLHVIYRLGVGGLENGVVNLINGLPIGQYRHAILCLTHSTDFKKRLKHADVEIYELNKKDGQDWRSLWRAYRLFKQLKPALVHSRNLAALEYQLPAWLAGVKRRIHSEHGWDIFDPDGSNQKYQRLRRLFRPLIHRYVALSGQLERYLSDRVEVPSNKLTRICNGVDTNRFYPLRGDKPQPPGCPFHFGRFDIVIGTIGRMHGVKDQLTLVRAFVKACERQPGIKQRVKLILVGDGPLRRQAIDFLRAENMLAICWLPGERNDIADILRCLDIFVLPSQAEGISNTILEAMATALPVIATAVGGNIELVDDGKTGKLTPPGDADAMADKILDYLNDGATLHEHARHAYRRALAEFSLAAMIDRYQTLYDSLLNDSFSKQD